MRANERTDERVAQYLRLYSCLFQTIVHWVNIVRPLDFAVNNSVLEAAGFDAVSIASASALSFPIAVFRCAVASL